MNALKLFKNLSAPQIDAKASLVDEFPPHVNLEYDAQLFCKDQLSWLADITEDNDPNGNQTLRWAIFLNFVLNKQPQALAGLDEQENVWLGLKFEDMGNMLFSPVSKETESDDDPKLSSLASFLE